MKWGLLHQGKDFSVSSLDPRRKGRFDSVCIAGITAQLPISLLASSRVPARAARLSLTGPAHFFHTHVTSLSLGESYPGVCWQLAHDPRCCPGEQRAPPSACSTAPGTTGSRISTGSPAAALLSLGALSDESEAPWAGSTVPWHSQSPLHRPHLAAGEIWWHCHILLFGHISLWDAEGTSPGAQEGMPGSVSALQVKHRLQGMEDVGTSSPFQFFPTFLAWVCRKRRN